MLQVFILIYSDIAYYVYCVLYCTGNLLLFTKLFFAVMIFISVILIILIVVNYFVLNYHPQSSMVKAAKYLPGPKPLPLIGNACYLLRTNFDGKK